MSMGTAEFEKIMSDPSAGYKGPEDVVVDERLSREQKIAVLNQWAYDEREIEVAEEENMRSDARSTRLRQVLLVLHKFEQ